MTPEELAYYRAAEDHFARLRGTPFIFSPKDFALLKRWWEECVPLAAVLAGVGEVFERRRERQGDVVSSLSYCRHAVSRHARRLAATVMDERPASPVDVGGGVARCAAEVREAAVRWGGVTAVAGALAALAAAIESLPADASPAGVDETLARLEQTALETIGALLPAEVRSAIDAAVEEELTGVAGDEAALGRMRKALLVKERRRALGLARLELLPPEA